jgi:rhomboid family GlyGly-CTERM serine protease
MIAAGSLRSALRAARVPLLIGLVIALLLAGGETARQALAFDRIALAQGQVWRLLSAHAVHLGGYHAVLNLIALLALVLLCPAPLPAREWLRRITLLALAVSALLYLFAPEVDRYVGFSGVLHGLFLLGLLPQARAGDRIAIACLAYLAGKILWEQIVGVPLSDQAAIGGRVVTQAHLFGTLAGLAYALAFGSIRKGETSQ